ncbi:MAG: hypothetical protein IPM57_10965 [Oligoflexia bacterium]|nr:hypothetical protein [Oligoflexia bacterium]
MVSKFGLTPTWLLTAGVVAYIIKDRIKELSKNFLAGKVEKVVADVEKVLIYKGQEEKPVELGRIKEYVRGIKAKELSSEVYSVRYAHDMSDIEAEIGEDIIHYNKKIFINKKSNKNIKNEWGLREIIRFSLSQYLQNLDDPFKEVSFIDDLGKLCRHEAHRVYYAHLAFQFSYKSPEGQLFKDVKLAKLVLDKQGLVKVTHAVQNEIYV